MSEPRTAAVSAAPALVEGAFAIEGMHCGSCVALIEEAVAEEPGVTEVAVDLDAARASVTFDPHRHDLDAIGAVITALGYPATPLRAPAASAGRREGGGGSSAAGVEAAVSGA